ncbi:MAG: alpha/beta hydrolase [Myxococcales bacterium]|nr:alpha/beta hydrolase [Myxococcales bacterium]MCB9756291.1 alpha/beta hydrolase [Myxococcales bacterium]
MRVHVPERDVKRVRAGGLEFAYLEEGEGPLVLLLHGFPDTAHTWDDVRPALAAAGFRAVSPFTRGYAPSEIPSGDVYDSDTLGRDALALIEALGDGPACLVGHDWGASAAYSAAGLGGRAAIRKLVTVAIPHPAAIRPSPRLMWGARHFVTLRLPGAARRFARDDFAEVERLYRRWSPTWELPPGETEAVKNAYAAPGCLRAALGYYRCLRPTPPPGQRVKIDVPTLTFGGRDDGVATPAMFHGAARRFTGEYRVVMTSGGHFLHREAPQEFLGPLLEFLRE